MRSEYQLLELVCLRLYHLERVNVRWRERAGGECRTLALPRTKRALSHPSITGEVPPTRFERAHAGFGPAASSGWATGARWLGPRVLTPTRMVDKTVLGDRPGPSRSAPY